MAKIISDIGFMLNEKVKGTYLKYGEPHNVNTRVRTSFSGRILKDFDDSSYEVYTATEEVILVELYDGDTMERVNEL